MNETISDVDRGAAVRHFENAPQPVPDFVINRMAAALRDCRLTERDRIVRELRAEADRVYAVWATTSYERPTYKTELNAIVRALRDFADWLVKTTTP